MCNKIQAYFPLHKIRFVIVYDWQFNSADLDAISAFENIFDLAVMQFIVAETNRYAEQK